MMGKKFLLATLFAITVTLSAVAAESNDSNKDIRVHQKEERGFWPQLGRDILLYIPNRIIDISDLFSFRVDAGAPFALKVKATNFFQLGGTHGSYYFLEKGYNRQCGGGYCDGSIFGMLMFDSLDQTITETSGSVEPFTLEKGFGMANPELVPYVDNNVDFWAIGVDAGFVLGLGLDVHLRELPDLVLGFFFFDINGDDFK